MNVIPNKDIKNIIAQLLKDSTLVDESGRPLFPRRNVLSNMKNSDELITFTKYPKLAPELRHHMLTYCDLPTLHNYSKCTNFCNSEIQRFNTRPPVMLHLEQKSDGVVVQMRYARSAERWCRDINSKFKFADFENVMEEVQKYVTRYYKYVEEKTTGTLVINLKQWPAELIKTKHITNIKRWRVNVYHSMCNGFADNFKNSGLNIMDLTLTGFYQVIIPSDFFKCDVVRNLRKLYVDAECEIDSEDFVNLSNDNVYFESSINFDDIRAKVRKWNSENNTEQMVIRIDLPTNDERRFVLTEVFPTDQFHVVAVADGTKIGKVEVKITNHKGLGKTMDLTFGI